MVKFNQPGLRGLPAALILAAAVAALPQMALAASVLSITPTSTGPSRATTEAFRVVFDEPVTGVSTDDFGLSVTGSAGGSISGVAGSGADYHVHLTGIHGTGTLRLDLGAGTNIRTASSAPIPAFTTGQVRIVNDAATAIPTLTEWAMILMALALVGAAALRLTARHRRA
ncbi:IPTL-CTERM sorting domain-containing protein [Brevundimonas vesicularis]|uniref:IPTL-CTERM sorting domain-containing protein n=1 Tax=Brevundimonas vesicularis TaxID=41276 RepID=UPI0038D4A3CC